MYHYSKVIVQINLGNFGSTGTIMRGIADCASREGFKVFCCYPDNPHNKSIQDGDYIICTDRQRKICSRLSRYSGLNGLFGVFPTIRFIKWLREVKPQIIHLHNLHGCGLSLPILFRYIKRKKIRVVWTLHDCWAFTGRCPYFQITKCDKWKTGCHDCSYPKTSYPETKVDGTRLMWKLKKKWFNGIADLTIVTPSSWLANLVQDSFLSSYSICVINNGIDLSVFKPTPSNFREHYDLGGGENSNFRSCLFME